MKTRWLVALTAATSLVIGLGLGIGLAAGQPDPDQPEQLTPPARAQPGPAELAPDVLQRVGRAVVLIERRDAIGNNLPPVVGFVIEGGLVVTSRHCMLGVCEADVNAGADGLHRVTSLYHENVDDDLVVLRTDSIPGTIEPLRVVASRQPAGLPVWIVLRERDGALRTSPGLTGRTSFDTHHGGHVATTCPAWPGCSGGPIILQNGDVVAVLHTRLSPSSSVGTCGAAVVEAVRSPHAVSLREWPGSSQSAMTASQTAQRASQSRQAGQHEQALRLARAAAEADPSSPKCVLEVTRAMVALQKPPSDCSSVLSEFLDREPESAVIWLALGIYSLQAGDPQGAERAIRRSLELRPSAEGWFWVGWGFQRRLNTQERNTAWEEALRLEPDHPRAFAELSRGYRAAEQYGDLLRIVRARIPSDPRDPEDLLLLARALKLADDPEYHPTLTKLTAASPYAANRVKFDLVDYDPRTDADSR